MKHKKGFTLIELLVVITIIGILSAVGLASYQVANQKAQDGRRQADAQAIQSALEVYRSEHDEYPSDIYDGSLDTYFTSGTVPVDPDGDPYAYDQVSSYEYTLTYNLEVGDAYGPHTVNNP